MSEAYLIGIFQRNGQLFVSPAVGSTLGFQNLPGVIAVPSREELLPALEVARAQIEAAWARPTAERFPEGTDYYVAAGASSWADFVRGTVSVSIRYGRKDTEIRVLVPDATYKRLEATDSTRTTTHPVDLPLADAASVALKLLDEIPDKQRCERARKQLGRRLWQTPEARRSTSTIRIQHRRDHIRTEHGRFDLDSV